MDETQKRILSSHSEILGKLHNHLKSVGRFPHEGQARIIRAFFNDRKKILQGQCGRSTGKTEAAIYIATRFALTNPGSETYIICPELKQAKKIYWLKRRLQNFGPQDFIFEHRESELRTVYNNGSYIILDGCENYEALRGIKPDLVIYDEFQHHTQYFDEEVMQPNLSSGKVSLVVFGTPPKRHCYYVDFRENLLENIRLGDKDCFYMELISESNPTLDKEWLKKKKAELIRKDKFNVWLREYEGKLVFDTESAIFPFFKPEKHVKPHELIQNLIRRDRKKLNWYAFYDPGTTTVFGALFIAVNPYTSQIFILDEIYAEERKECTAQSVYSKAIQKKDALNDNEDAWTEYYDEAGAWFANEVQQIFNKNLIPTHKQKAHQAFDEGRAGESILNTAMMQENIFFVSEKCEKFIWELGNYVQDEQGRYPKTHDHLMDLLFYFVQNTRYTIVEEVDTDFLYEETKEAKRSFNPLIGLSKSSHDLDMEHANDFYDGELGANIWN